MPPEQDRLNRIITSLAVLDERTQGIQTSLTELKETVETNKIWLTDEIEVHYNDVSEKVEKQYTKKSDFNPVQRLVYGFVGFMLLAMGTMVVNVVVKAYNIPGGVAISQALGKMIEKSTEAHNE